MRKLKIIYFTFFAILLLSYPLSAAISQIHDFFSSRVQILNLLGYLAFSTMSIAMILALRLSWLEKKLGGLDKIYRLHKWLGITGLVLGCIHWMWFQFPKWAVGLGWLIKPHKKRIDYDGILALLYQQRKLAEFIGEWAFYILVIVLFVALLKIFSYSIFRFIHRIIPLLYLALAFHAIILFQFNYWLTLSGIILGGLVLGGVIAAVISLTQQIGSSKKYQATIVELNKPAASSSLSLVLESKTWRGHQAGQFAFLKLSPNEAAHPFTIASGWNKKTQRLAFIIKELGDYTQTLTKRLQIGETVTIEGPYGGFDFNMASGVSIWIAAGVGITPFIAKLEAMTNNPATEQKTIDLFYCSNEIDTALIQRLQDITQHTGVKLHLISGKDNRLTGERLRNLVPNYRHASVWYCGNKQFAASLMNDLTAHGLSAASFHQEFYEFR